MRRRRPLTLALVLVTVGGLTALALDAADAGTWLRVAALAPLVLVLDWLVWTNRGGAVRVFERHPRLATLVLFVLLAAIRVALAADSDEPLILLGLLVVVTAATHWTVCLLVVRWTSHWAAGFVAGTLVGVFPPAVILGEDSWPSLLVALVLAAIAFLNGRAVRLRTATVLLGAAALSALWSLDAALIPLGLLAAHGVVELARVVPPRLREETIALALLAALLAPFVTTLRFAA